LPTEPAAWSVVAEKELTPPVAGCSCRPATDDKEQVAAAKKGDYQGEFRHLIRFYLRKDDTAATPRCWRNRGQRDHELVYSGVSSNIVSGWYQRAPCLYAIFCIAGAALAELLGPI
jgi:hypothetical protein